MLFRYECRQIVMNRSRKWQRQTAVAGRKAFVGTELSTDGEMAEECSYLPPGSRSVEFSP
jgi:hypothetical protein